MSAIRPSPDGSSLGDQLLSRELLFVTGKGGVGKTTIAAALAVVAAESGKRVLVCEIEPVGALGAAFEAGPTGFEPRQVAQRIWVMSMDTEASLREYLRVHVRFPVGAGRIGPLARAFDFVATAAPGVREILTVGKLCFEVRERHFDLVIVDASASGHVVSQLGAPQAIRELVRVGQVRDQTGWMLDILSDPGRTGVVAVSTPEEMPVAETIELAARLEHETPVGLLAVIVNRVLPELFGTREEEVFEALSSEDELARINQLLGAEVGPIFDAARLAVKMRRTRAEHLVELRAHLGPGVPLLLVPFRFARTEGVRATRQVAAALGEELG
ncbi:MAG: ArsA family ATPase [Acidimicrobiales bacterium]